MILITKISPTQRLLLLLSVILIAFIFPIPLLGYILTAIFLIVASFIGKGKLFIRRYLRSAASLFIAIFILQTIFLSNGVPVLILGIITFHKAGLVKAIAMTSKLSVFISGMILYFLTTTPRELIQYLEEKGMNSNVSHILLMTFQVIEDTKKRAVTIMNSQQTRGLETEGNLFCRLKSFLLIIIPLVLSSIVYANEQALALEARGFAKVSKRTILFPLGKFPYDKKAQIIALCLIICCIIGRILWLILL